MEEDDPERKTWGFLSNLRYPAHTHSAATPEQGRKLYYEIWQTFGDEYGVFTVDYSNWNTILPINNAPGNWSMQDLKEDHDEDTMSEGSRPSSPMDVVDSGQGDN